MQIPENPSQETIREKIIEYLTQNPIDRSIPDCYKKASDKFGVSTEKIRRIYRTLRERGLVEADQVIPNSSPERSFKEDVRTGQAEFTTITSKRVKTLKDLIELCEVDEKEWEVTSWEATKWEVGRKDKTVNWQIKKGVVKHGDVFDSGKIFVEPLYRVKAKLSRRKLSKDLGLQKEALLAEIKAYTASSDLFETLNKYSSEIGLSTPDEEKTYLLELSLPDPHFGKLAWREETDEDYDIKIAEQRFKTAIRKLLARVNLKTIKKILFPLGNDLLNIDNRQNTTVNGTPQDTDVRFMKIIKIVRRVLVEIITELSIIAPVDVVIVPGNHDSTSMFMMGEILDAFFHGNERVKIENAPKGRKYYKFGLNGIQLTHGNEEKHDSLGLIFATEQPKLWADTKFRFCQLGHFHKNKKTQYVSVDEHQGFLVQIIPSLSGTDYWHKSKGYNSLKQAKAFLFDEKEGPVGEFTTTVLN